MHEEDVLIPVPQDKATGENRHAEETLVVQFMHVFFIYQIYNNDSHHLEVLLF